MSEILLSQRLPVLALRGLNVFPGMTIGCHILLSYSVVIAHSFVKNVRPEKMFLSFSIIRSPLPCAFRQ